jgi:pimeloyl-ACP methyl ester carboxylesterase
MEEVAPVGKAGRPAAAPGGRAIALDWRGHGASDRPAADYTTDDLLDDAPWTPTSRTSPPGSADNPRNLPDPAGA